MALEVSIVKKNVKILHGLTSDMAKEVQRYIVTWFVKNLPN